MKIAAGQSRAVTVAFTNANGVKANVQGEIEWSSSDESIAKVEGKGEQATITAGPSAGEAEITASADADLGEGVAEVEAVLEVEVIARGEATGGEITPVMPGQGLPGQGGGPVDPGYGQGGGSGGRPDNSLPGSPGHPDQGLPPSQGRPDNSLPGSPGHPDQGLPGSQPGVDNELPGSGGSVDNSLPDHAKPKR